MEANIAMCCEEISPAEGKRLLESDDEEVCILPIHPVIRLDSPSTPVRPVMDASPAPVGRAKYFAYDTTHPETLSSHTCYVKCRH